MPLNILVIEFLSITHSRTGQPRIGYINEQFFYIKMEKQVITKLTKNFEDYAHREEGVEFWYARDLQELLNYDEWRNFLNVIEKAKTSCKNSGQKIEDHFVGANNMVK